MKMLHLPEAGIYINLDFVEALRPDSNPLSGSGNLTITMASGYMYDVGVEDAKLLLDKVKS